MASDYTVTSQSCSVYLATGAMTLLYKGAKLPATADMQDGEAKRLLDGGFVVKGEDTATVDETPAEMKAGDDPGDFSVAQVKAFLETADEDEKARVLEAETAGKNRSSLTGS